MSGDQRPSALRSLWIEGTQGTQSTVDSTVERLTLACVENSQQHDEEPIAAQQPNNELNRTQASVPGAVQSVPTTATVENPHMFLAYSLPGMVILNPAGDQTIQQPTTWPNNGAYQQYGTQYPVVSPPSFSAGHSTATSEAVQYSSQFWYPCPASQCQPGQVQSYPTPTGTPRVGLPLQPLYYESNCFASDITNNRPCYNAGRARAPKNPRKPEEHKHACPECGKRFLRPGAVETHMKMHTGEKPFQCPIPTCPRHRNWFSVKSNMVRHCRNAHASQEEFLISKGVQINKSSQDKR